MNKAAISHFTEYVSEWMQQGISKEAATLNYTRQFPARIPTLLVAFLDATDGQQTPSEVQ